MGMGSKAGVTEHFKGDLTFGTVDYVLIIKNAYVSSRCFA